MFLQLLFNTIITGLMLTLVAIGFNIIFNTTKVFHLAHGALFAGGAYFYIFFSSVFNANTVSGLLLTATFSLFGVCFVGFLIEYLVYRPLNKKQSGQAITLISSTGVYLFLINLIAILFGNETKYLDPGLGNSFVFYGIIVVPIQIIQLICSVILIVVILIFSYSRWYLPFKAVSGNEIISSLLGINIRILRMAALVLGSVLASIAGILRMYDTGIDPHAGMSVTLSSAVAVILGGNSSLLGTLLACLLISSIQTTTEWYFSAQWKDGITFLLLIGVILWRTEGIVSFKMRVEEK